MSTDRKEPTLSAIPLDREEDRKAAARAAGAASKPAAPAARPVTTTVARPSPLLPFALMLALTGLGLAGFIYWQLQKAQLQLGAAEGRITQLESRLTLSDDESAQSVTALQARLKETAAELKLAHAEIRKLWDTRNVNRKGIADNKSKLAKLEKSAKAATTAAANANALAQSQKETLNALGDDVQSYGEQITRVSEMSEGQQKRVRELVDRSNQIDSQLKQLRNDLARRVKTNEEAIEAIDAYRVNINRDILELKRQLNPAQ
jgi:chromosome segregation ATPase